MLCDLFLLLFTSSQLADDHTKFAHANFLQLLSKIASFCRYLIKSGWTIKTFSSPRLALLESDLWGAGELVELVQHYSKCIPKEISNMENVSISMIYIQFQIL